MFAKLDMVGRIAGKVDADAVIDAGDLIHVKAASRNSHELVRRIIECHTAYPCPTYLLPGNHDISFANYESISKQPVGVLFASGKLRHLTDTTIEKGGICVRVVGVPYAVSPTIGVFDIKKGDEDVLIVVTHALVSRDGKFTWRGEYNTEPVFSWVDLAELDADVFVGGHWHRDQGAYKDVEKDTWFVYPGSLSRGTLIHDNMDRIPKVGIISVSRDGSGTVVVDVNTCKLPVPDSDRVFNIERRYVERDMRQQIDAFILSLTKDTSVDAKAVVMDRLKALAPSNEPDVLAKSVAYLEEAVSCEGT